MEHVEGQAQQNDQSSEGEANQAVDVKALMERLEQLESTNNRLLSESKENAEKYRSARDKLVQKEKIELEQNDNWKERLELEKNEKSEWVDKFNALKKETLKKDLNFNVAKMVSGVKLNKGVTVDHVIDEVLKTGMVEVDEDNNSFMGLNDAFAKVKNDAVFLFDIGKAPMTNAMPQGAAPEKKKMSKDDLFRAAIKTLNK